MEQEKKPQVWRSLVGLAAGIILFVVFAILMVWIGSLIR